MRLSVLAQALLGNSMVKKKKKEKANRTNDFRLFQLLQFAGLYPKGLHPRSNQSFLLCCMNEWLGGL